MFSAEQLVIDCRQALADSRPARAVKEVVQRAAASPAQVLSALGTPARAGLFPIYQSATLTILNVIWAPGMSIYPHDHRMWAVIGVYGGTEDNVFYKRAPEGLVRAASKRLEIGATALLGEETVHAVTNPLGTFTGAIQIYGGDFFGTPRSEFDPQSLEERPFDVEKAKSLFQEANRAVAR
jgi:predicted metal-dependent enzyme (double-stranded beta helix superfamily)